MGIFSKFENKMEDTVEGAASRMSKAPISPVQIAKKAEKQMRRETMVGAGKQYAPTLYTVLVNPDDDDRLFGYYPTLAGETETYLSAKAAQDGLEMDGNPLVRFIVDDGLRHGKFDVVAELVAAPIIAKLRDEEMERYGLAPQSGRGRATVGAASGRSSRQTGGRGDYGAPQPQQVQPQAQQGKPPLPYVPENEIDRSIDYGEYTFNSEDFEDYRDNDPNAAAPAAYNDLAGQPQRSRGQQGQAMQQADTVAFAGGAGGQAPDRNAVKARLIDRSNGRPYDLGSTRISIGRESGNDVTVADLNASRRHAELALNQQGLWVISDLRSMNGTLVNGVSVASQPLYPGDIITIGTTDLEFTLV